MVKSLGIFRGTLSVILLSASIFTFYAFLFFVSGQAYDNLQTISRVFGETVDVLLVQRLKAFDAPETALFQNIDLATTEKVIKRFERISNLLWFKSAVSPSRELTNSWIAWQQGGSGTGEQLLKALLEGRASIDKISVKVHSAFDLTFLCFGFLLSIGAAGSVAFYARLRSSQSLERSALAEAERFILSEKETRRKIAMELHDDIAQDIVAAKMLCERSSILQTIVERAANESPAALMERATETLAGVTVKIRSLLVNLRSDNSKVEEISTALAEVCRTISRKTGADIRVSGFEAFPPCPDYVGQMILSIVKEAVTNAVKYARRGTVTVQGQILNILPSGQSVEIVVRDCGYVQSSERTLVTRQGWNLGMDAMKERAATIKAALSIDLNPVGSKVCLRLIIPGNNRERDHI